jgi:hypothetical protein
MPLHGRPQHPCQANLAHDSGNHAEKSREPLGSSPIQRLLKVLHRRKGSAMPDGVTAAHAGDVTLLQALHRGDPHRSVRAQFRHTALTSGRAGQAPDVEALARPWMHDAWARQVAPDAAPLGDGERRRAYTACFFARCCLNLIGVVGVVLGDAQIGLVDMMQQPVEHIGCFAHRR